MRVTHNAIKTASDKSPSKQQSGIRTKTLEKKSLHEDDEPNHPLSQLQQNQARRYEEMAQSFNLESLIKQAYQKQSLSGPAYQISQHPQQRHFEYFEGDRDQVEDEEELSPKEMLTPQQLSQEKKEMIMSTPGCNLMDSAVMGSGGNKIEQAVRMTLGMNPLLRNMSDVEAKNNRAANLVTQNNNPF